MRLHVRIDPYDVARSNTVMQVGHHCSRGNSEFKYILFLAQISVQMHTPCYYYVLEAN